MPRTVRVTKRMIDILAAVAGLTVTLPFYPIIALAIRLDSPGPIFYKQRRAGAMKRNTGGGPPEFTDFWIVKFRTMGVDAEKHTGAVVASKGDARVTKVGRFLRKTRIDELPQFLNVLKGDMSLVGPRPERPELLADLALAIPFFEERLREAKPGLTGLAQVSLGYTGAMPDDSELAEFRDVGGDGIEVFSASQTFAEAEDTARCARVFGLLGSTGSDFHDPDESPLDLGALPPLPIGIEPVWSRW